MLTILKEDKSVEICDFFEKNQTSCPPDDAVIFVAREKEKILAAGTLVLKNYKVFLETAVVDKNLGEDKVLLNGLSKSLLNFADLRGIKTVYGDNPELIELYKMLRFSENEIYELSLEGYFTCEH